MTLRHGLLSVGLPLPPRHQSFWGAETKVWGYTHPQHVPHPDAPILSLGWEK